MSTGEERESPSRRRPPRKSPKASLLESGHHGHQADRAGSRQELLRTLTEEAIRARSPGTRTSRARSTRASRPSMQAISKQLAAIMHHPTSRSWKAPGAACTTW